MHLSELDMQHVPIGLEESARSLEKLFDIFKDRAISLFPIILRQDLLGK